MKKTIILLLAMVATMSLSAQIYALHLDSVNSPVIAEGDTVVYTATEAAFSMDRLYINFYIDNLTEDPVLTNNEVTLLEGPANMNFEVCAGGYCPQRGSYTLAPGQNPYMPLTVEPFTAGMRGKTALFRVVVGEEPSLTNSVTVFLKVVFPANNGIADREGAVAGKVYPNPTSGKVTVGDKEYDLSGRPAGVYYLPANGGNARVIKL